MWTGPAERFSVNTVALRLPKGYLHPRRLTGASVVRADAPWAIGWLTRAGENVLGDSRGLFDAAFLYSGRFYRLCLVADADILSHIGEDLAREILGSPLRCPQRIGFD
jgi:hypothetical protein